MRPVAKLSIIIPVFNEENNPYFFAIIQSLAGAKECEVIYCDGGSTDKTVSILTSHGLTVIEHAGKNRAARLNSGIARSQGQMILLHHPRSLLQPEAFKILVESSTQVRWGGFTHRFDQKHPVLKFTSWYSTRVRPEISGILYLDHCIFFHRDCIDQDAQPVPEIDIFEDTEFSKKLLRHSKPQILQPLSTTSAIRFSKNGVLRQILLNQFLKLGYHLNLSESYMNRIYEKKLGLNNRY